jgi:predicted DNA-binding transcriptional regulator AlpA
MSRTLTSTEPLLTSRDVAALLAKTHATVCAWSKAARLPCFRLPDGSYRYRRSEIDAWLAARSNR